jgi:hypothetical protein
MQLSTFLRTVLKLDAASCLGMAALVIPTAAALSTPLGIEAQVLTGAAISLIPIGLFILWLGLRKDAPAAFVYLVILGNVGWAVASLASAFGLPGITALGSLLVAGQGLFVLAMAALEWRGVRQSQGAAAIA